MRAVQIIDGSNTFTVQSQKRLKLRTGGAIVRMEAALVAPYMAALPSGAWMTPPRPFIPGQCAIGVVEESSGDLQLGQRVYFDAYTGSNDPAHPCADHGFLGCFAVAPGAMRALANWPNGSFSELIHAPERCFSPIPDGIRTAPELLCRMGWLGTALAGLERGGFQPGMTLAINGATGLLGASAVALALALDAGSVQIVGRRRAILDSLVKLDPARVCICDLRSTEPIDMLLDCAGGDDTATTEALIARLRRFGTAAFVGALTTPLHLDSSALMRNGNTIAGSFWFTADARQRLLALVADGKLDLSCFAAKRFDISEIIAAISHAQAKAGGLTHTVLVPEI